jgi:phytoene synthase
MNDARAHQDEAFAHCEALVRAHDKDRFIATLFAPADKRAPLCALYAFALEIAQVRLRVTQPLAGEIRLQWWRDVLTGTASGDEEGHPVAVALEAARARCGLAAEPLLAFIDAHAAAFYPEPPPDHAALLSHARESQLAIFDAAAHILDARAQDALVSDAARIHGVAEIMRSGIWREGVTPAQRQALCEDALARLADLRVLLEAAPAAVAPAFLVLAVDRAVLRRALRNDDPARVQQSPWLRQWMLWRAARRWPRIV